MSQGAQVFTGIAIGVIVLAVIGVLIGSPVVGFVILAIGLVGAAISIFGSRSRDGR